VADGELGFGAFGPRRGAAQTKYRQFVADGVRQPARPWEQLVGQVYLGGEALPAIARRMGVSYSAVSRRVSAVARRQGEARRFHERLARLSDGKVQT